MQAFNQELVECIENLKATKLSIEKQIETEENERQRLQHEIERMTQRINCLSESLLKKAAAREDYERTIEETESAYKKILESSQLLLNMVKRESACLQNQTKSDEPERPEGSRSKSFKQEPCDDEVLCPVGKASAAEHRKRRSHHSPSRL